jgi:oligoribonuclease NrnB/cAMP/cGMP phosphodiesterase (DHH superfamily)
MPPPDVYGREVYVLDFSYPRAVMEEMHTQAASLCVIDHHKTAAEALAGLSFATFDMERSGAGMTWDHFFPGQPRPWIVNYVEDRDLWRKRLPDADAVAAFISTIPFTFEAWDTAAKLNAAMVAPTGRAVLARTEQYVVEIAKNAIRYRFEGFNVPLVNAPQMDISDLLAHLAQGEPFAMGWFQRADGMFQYSLRSRGEGGVDVAELARRHGGGGHAQAAGFQLDWPIHLDKGNEVVTQREQREYEQIKREILESVAEIECIHPAAAQYLREHLVFDDEKLTFMYTGDDRLKLKRL